MAQQTAAQARVVDPVLTEIARGYHNSEMVGMALFPSVQVQERGGQIITFSKEDFRLYNTRRTPGSKTNRVQFGYSGASYALEDHSLEGMLPRELGSESNAAGINAEARTVMGVQNIMALRLEYQQAVLATTAGNYAAANKVTLSGTGQWSDFTSGVSDPVANIETAKDAIRAATGRRPNTLVMGAAVFSKAKQHPKIVDRIKYTGRDVATPELLASLFGVSQVLVGDAIYESAAGTLADVWGKFVILAYTAKGTMAQMGEPTYGYTYRLSDYPIVESPYEDRNAKAILYPVTDAAAPVIAGADAGYLISAAVA